MEKGIADADLAWVVLFSARRVRSGLSIPKEFLLKCGAVQCIIDFDRHCLRSEIFTHLQPPRGQLLYQGQNKIPMYPLFHCTVVETSYCNYTCVQTTFEHEASVDISNKFTLSEL